MFKRILLLSTVFFFLVTSLSFSQLKSQKMRKAKDDVQVETKSSSAPQSLKKITVGTQLFVTDYDYAGNNTIPNMMEMYDFDENGTEDVVATAMQRADAGARTVLLVVGNQEGFTTIPMNQAGSHGWGYLQMAKEGPLAKNALVMTHGGGNSWLFPTDMTTVTTNYPSAHFAAGNFPSFVYLADGTIYFTNANGILFKSTDNLATLDSIGVLDPSDATDYPSEYPLKKSPDGSVIMHFGAWTFAGNGPIDGANADSTDFIGINYSTDSGATWQFEKIGRDGLTEVANRPGYFPIFENFGQVNGLVDNNGVMHITANGYGFYLTATDTTFAYPALYWNSRDRVWLAVTDESQEHGLYENDSVYVRPGNGLGNAYPVPSVSLDGQRVVIAWQGIEYAGAVGTSDINIFATTTDNPNPVHYTDLYYATSGNGGKSFSAPVILEGEKQTQESYPFLNQILTVESNGIAKLNYLYMVDAIPGTSLFDDNNLGSNDSYWSYNQKELDIPVSVNESTEKVVTFKLEQNYPNPFNPSTLINYNIPTESKVTLKIYDMLGTEVATLVNGLQTAGSHSVKLDASHLSSGLYIYTLKTNEFTSSKKMMLLK